MCFCHLLCPLALRYKILARLTKEMLLWLLLLWLLCISICHRLTLKDLALRCSDYYVGQASAFSSKYLSDSLPLLMPSHCLWVLLSIPLGTVSWAPNVQAFSSSFIWRFSSCYFLWSFLYLRFLRPLCSLWLQRLPKMPPHDCLPSSGVGWGSGRVRKVTCLAKPRWPPW